MQKTLTNDLRKININIESMQDEEKLSYAQYIAHTILEQCKRPNMYVFYSWGGSEWSVGINEDDNPFLSFSVNGNKFKGQVFVIYDINDTYNVVFVKDNTIVNDISTVYCDYLQDTIDHEVEDPDLYTKKDLSL